MKEAGFPSERAGKPSARPELKGLSTAITIHTTPSAAKRIPGLPIHRFAKQKKTVIAG
jgi:hypothetical protein